MIQKRIKWKISKLKIEHIESKYVVKGNVLVETDAQFYIPFGAIDADKHVAFEKAKSELCERVTWYNLYKNSLLNIPTTIGFAAHTNLALCKQHALGEFIERQVFERVIFDLIHDKEIDNYKVIKDCVLFIFKSDDIENYYFTIAVKFIYGRSFFGIGKSAEKNTSIDNAIDEAKLVYESITHFENREKLYDKDVKNLAMGDMRKFIKLSNNMEICERIHKFIDKYDIGVDTKEYCLFSNTSKKTFICDVTKYIPEEFTSLNRYICYVTDDNRTYGILNKKSSD